MNEEISDNALDCLICPKCGKEKSKKDTVCPECFDKDWAESENGGGR